MKSLMLLLGLVLTFGSLSAFSKGKCEQPILSKAEREQLDEQRKNELLQKILGAVDFKSSHININGIEGETTDRTKITIDIVAYLKFKMDLPFNFLDNGVPLPKECSEKEKFKTLIDVSSKDLLLEIKLQNKDNKGFLGFRFVTVVNKNGKNQLQEKPLRVTLVSNLNESVLKYDLHSIGLNYIQTDESKLAIDSNCKLTLYEGNVLTSTSSPVLATCYLRGTLENWINPTLKWAIKKPDFNFNFSEIP